MTKYKVSEIYAAKTIRLGDMYDTQLIMSHVSDGIISEYNDPIENDIVCRIVVDVSYDGERGARTYVLELHNKPFLVFTCAGRGLDDLQDWVVTDKPLYSEALLACLVIDVDVRDTDWELGLAYWNGQPVTLGG